MIDVLKSYQQQTEKYLFDSLEKSFGSQSPQILFEAINYSLKAGGKRVRPILVLMTAELFQKNTSSFLPLAAAFELLHSYSLIHDDLPSMDNDDLRRGMPTLHKKFGEALAILAGDTMQSMAYEYLFRLSQNEFSPSSILQAAQLFSEASGFNGMAGGQVLDIELLTQEISYNQMVEIHQKKTGALIRAAILSTAVLCQADEKALAQLQIYAEAFGLIFQIQDDILDYIGDPIKMGKPTGSDFRNAKNTFPTLLGINRCRELIAQKIQTAQEAMHYFAPHQDQLMDLLKYVADRDH